MKKLLLLVMVIGFTIFLRYPQSVGGDRLTRSIHVKDYQITQTGVVAGITDNGKKIIIPLCDILRIVED
jgi:hypothetical protein